MIGSAWPASIAHFLFIQMGWMENWLFRYLTCQTNITGNILIWQSTKIREFLQLIMEIFLSINLNIYTFCIVIIRTYHLKLNGNLYNIIALSLAFKS